MSPDVKIDRGDFDVWKGVSGWQVSLRVASRHVICHGLASAKPVECRNMWAE
ncbi:predicted protein [Plenodomus lingam JN3]|uniref:Predicted protein n=1 Tax=Leptosphaeria maculans (strain JN3 / isolate v23.1.3 / race Av1-4-5-6-7-8) TaxID=985895 RepID=E4ZUU7_LEPMJ|nr:predicted protein [Plenodomus lingam JN3]CBX95176.1 predicted protein [Plenodomus lingam JN3]